MFIGEEHLKPYKCPQAGGRHKFVHSHAIGTCCEGCGMTYADILKIAAINNLARAVLSQASVPRN